MYMYIEPCFLWFHYFFELPYDIESIKFMVTQTRRKCACHSCPAVAGIPERSELLEVLKAPSVNKQLRQN